MKNIIFIAPPAAGKGTQSALIEQKYNLPHISTGDILREVSQEDSEVGSYLRETLSSGKLVKDEIMYDLIEKRLSKEDCTNGYILDGFPRNVEQAKEYDRILDNLNQNLGYVIVLDIDEKILEKRITGRRVCQDCGAVYNLNTQSQQPKVESTCDKCNGRLQQRNDDNVESFKNRYQLYLEKTNPLLDYYRQKGVLYVVNGNESVEAVHQQIDGILKKGENTHDFN